MVISFSRSFLLIFANEARSVVRVTSRLVLRNLRIGAQRSCSDKLSVAALRGHDPVGRDALLDPLDQRGQKIALIRSYPAAAMSHSRDHKQPEEVRSRRSEARAHFLIVINAHQRI